jgi:hypothetical protein
MGKVIRLISKPERERIRLIREARAIYDSVFPPADPVPADPVNEQRDKARQVIPPAAPMPIAATRFCRHRSALQPPRFTDFTSQSKGDHHVDP